MVLHYTETLLYKNHSSRKPLYGNYYMKPCHFVTEHSSCHPRFLPPNWERLRHARPPWHNIVVQQRHASQGSLMTMRHAVATVTQHCCTTNNQISGKKWQKVGGFISGQKSPIANHKSTHFTNFSKIKIHNIYQICLWQNTGGLLSGFLIFWEKKTTTFNHWTP